MCRGECNSNPNYMHVYCPLSCDTCPEPLDVSSEDAMLLLEVANYGKPQKVEGKDAAETLEVVRRTVDYMKNVVLEGGVDLSEDIVGECRNKEECEFVCCCPIVAIALCYLCSLSHQDSIIICLFQYVHFGQPLENVK